MRDGYGFSEGDICFIVSWFELKKSILHSWGEISVLLLLWQCSWWFSSVPSGKSMFLTSLIGNMELLSTKCTGIGTQLAAKWKSHEFSRVAAGTWCIFSSYGRYLVYILELRRGWTFATGVCSPKSGFLSSYDGHLGKLNYAWQENTEISGLARRPSVPYYLAQL